MWRDREAAAVELAEQRLHVAQDGLAGGRIAHMADRGVAGQAVDHLAAGEVVADEAHAALGMEALAVEGDDAGRFLAAMLQRVQAERRDGGGVGMAEDAEHAALLAQPVVVEIDALAGEDCGGRCRVDPSSRLSGPGRGVQCDCRLGQQRQSCPPAVPGWTVAAGGVSGCSCSSGFVALQPLQDGALGVFRQHGHQPIARCSAARLAIWRSSPSRAGCGPAPARRRTGTPRPR